LARAFSEQITQAKLNTKMITATETYSHVGWSYQPWICHDDGDCTKLWHDFVHENGTTVFCDFSPYEKMTPEDIRIWIDLCMPDRIGCSPLDSQSLFGLWRKEHGI
jgi:hypothetical protein